jgi:regulator of nucleoside diphosphate kinase
MGDPMGRIQLFITESDFQRLKGLIESAKRFLRRDRPHLDALEEELNRAEIVGSNELPANVVTMNSRIRVTDLDTRTQVVYTLSFPRDADIAHDRISVLAPIGTALLGYRAGTVIQAEVPGGKKRLRIDEVMSPALRQTAA